LQWRTTEFAQPISSDDFHRGARPDAVTNRSAVRGAFGAFGQRIRGLLHNGDADAPTTQAAAVGDEAAMGEPSSRASSRAGSSSTGSSLGGGSAGDGSAGADADGS
jgi:hypothetical protein